MPTFPKGHHAYLARVENAKLIARLTPDTTPTRATTSTRFEFPQPVDLRGIPAIGRGVAGAIPGTNPDNICHRRN